MVSYEPMVCSLRPPKLHTGRPSHMHTQRSSEPHLALQLFSKSPSKFRNQKIMSILPVPMKTVGLEELTVNRSSKSPIDAIIKLRSKNYVRSDKVKSESSKKDLERYDGFRVDGSFYPQRRVIMSNLIKPQNKMND